MIDRPLPACRLTRRWFYDFNLTSNDRSPIYTMAGTFPLWQNITPSEIIDNEQAALDMVSGLRFLLGKYSGLPSIATLVSSGLNWDFPNAWPPHLYTAIRTFEKLGTVIGNATVLQNLTLTYDGVVPGHLGLNESELQEQPLETVGNVSLYTAESQGKPWPLALSIEYANR